MSETDLVAAPVEGVFIGFIKVAIRSSGNQLLTNDRDLSFNSSFVTRPAHFSRVGHEAEVPFEIRIGRIQSRIVEIRLEDTAFQIIEQYGLWTTLKKIKGPQMAVDPSSAVLTKDERRNGRTGGDCS